MRGLPVGDRFSLRQIRLSLFCQTRCRSPRLEAIFHADGLDNLAEQTAGTSPNNPDTDGDGLGDASDVAAGSDPLDLGSTPPAVPALHPLARGVLVLLFVVGSLGRFRGARAGRRSPGKGRRAGADR